MTLVWEIYASCYDTVAALWPYRRMVGEMVDAAGPDPRRVLDAGCGTGNLTVALLAARPEVGEVVAVDRSPAMLRRARAKSPRATHLHADLDGDLSELTGTFDAILCGNVLYALADPRRTVEVLKSRLAPGGRLVVTTPRAGAGTTAILRQHLRARGPASLARLLAPLLVVGLINARLLRTPAYHFLTEDQIKALMGTPEVRETYAGQAWLAVFTAPGAVRRAA